MLRALICACLVLAGCSSTKQHNPTDKPIRVSCEGRTFEQAKSVCFANAIEFAVGAVVVAETEVRKSKLTKDEILKHSSGYVDDYTIEGRIDNPNRVLLIMDVTVKHSKIAERIMGVQTATGEIKGSKLDAQYSSFMQNKASGDKLLSQVLNDFPRYAVNIQKGEVKYQVDIDRNPVVVVPYTIKWNYKYLQALNEVLALTHDGASRNTIYETVSVSSKDPSAWFLGNTEHYYFNDRSRALMIKKTFVPRLYVHVIFKDSNGRVLKSGCDDGFHLAGPNITEPFRISGNDVIDEEMVITIRSNKHKMAQLAEIEVRVSEKSCTIVD